MSKKFDRCVKSVRKTVKARKGSNKESAAIAICTTTLLHPRGRTLKRYRKGKLVTQTRRKIRGGAITQADIENSKVIVDEIKKAFARDANIDIPEEAEGQETLFESLDNSGTTIKVTLPKPITPEAANKAIKNITIKDPTFGLVTTFRWNAKGEAEMDTPQKYGLEIYGRLKYLVIPDGPTGMLASLKKNVGSVVSAVKAKASEYNPFAPTDDNEDFDEDDLNPYQTAQEEDDKRDLRYIKKQAREGRLTPSLATGHFNTGVLKQRDIQGYLDKGLIKQSDLHPPK